jgi:hypothetical protein
VPEVPATASEATVPTQVPVKQAYDDLSKQHYEAVSQLQSAEQSGTATEEMYSAVQESERKVIAAEDALEKAGWRQGKTPQDEWDYLPPTPQPVTPPVDVAALQKRKAAIEASIAPSKAIGQRTAYDEELAGINGQLGVPPEGPVNAPGGATVAPETPGGVPVADIPPEDVKYAGGEPVPQAATEPVGGNVAGFEKTYGPGEIPAGETLLPEEAFAKAQARMASGVAKPYSFVARAKTGAITPTEMGDLVAEHDRLINEAAAREGTPEYDGAYQAAKDFATNILKPAETAWHQKGMVMQIKAPVDYSRLTGFRQAMEKRIGREMTPTEAPAFQEAANDVAKSEGEAQVAQKASIERVQKHFSKTPDVAFEDAASAMHKQIEELTRPCIL